MKSEYKSNVCIILGMHRSGTSLLARWLQKCGLDIGKNLLKGDEFSNKDGHFEDIDFLDFHQEVLKCNNLPTSGLYHENIEIHISNNEKDKLNDLIQKKSIKGQWGWKDPRTILFLKLYNQLLPNAFHLIIIRNPFSVSKSLYNRDLRIIKEEFKKGEISILQFIKRMYLTITTKKVILKNYLDIWTKYNDELLSLIQKNNNKKCLVIDFNDFLQVDKGIIDSLKSEGFKLHYSPIKELLIMKKFSKISSKEDSTCILYEKLLAFKFNLLN